MPPSPTIADCRFAAIDFESAGATRGSTDTPVQVGIAQLDPPHTSVAPDSVFVSYIAPGGPVTWSAQKVHGISSAELEDAPSMNALWPEFKTRLTDRTLVAHGAGTERRFLRAFPMHGFGPWLDTLTLSKRLMPSLPDHQLSTVASALSLTDEITSVAPARSWHDALYDAVASLLILRALIHAADLGQLPRSSLLG